MKPHHEYPQPAVIETARLILRPMREEDAAIVVAWRNEPSSLAMFSAVQPITQEQHLAWFNSERKGRVDYVVVRKDTGLPIGVLNFKNISEETHTAESGRLIGDLASRGQGFAREAAVGWFYYGFQVLGLQIILGHTRRENAANIALNHSLGYVENTNASQEPDFINMVLHRDAALASPLFQQYAQASKA